MAAPLPDDVARKLAAAEGLVRGFDRVIVAFSGGVDSTVLAALALRTLGRERVLAVTADSASMARQDLADAVQLARHVGLRHHVIATREVERPEYRRNTPQRCYLCKQELFTGLQALARRQQAAIIYGAIADDLRQERPGQEAAAAQGVRAPLQEAGLEKWELRQIAKDWQLPNWNKPQNACLASRIPHGMDVTEEKLQQVELAEAFLASEGFAQARVRHLGAHARIEVEAPGVARFDETAFAEEVAGYFGALGFESVGVDLDGYRSGGANSPAREKVLQ